MAIKDGFCGLQTEIFPLLTLQKKCFLLTKLPTFTISRQRGISILYEYLMRKAACTVVSTRWRTIATRWDLHLFGIVSQVFWNSYCALGMCY